MLDPFRPSLPAQLAGAPRGLVAGARVTAPTSEFPAAWPERTGRSAENGRLARGQSAGRGSVRMERSHGGNVTGS